MGITATVIDPSDMASLRRVLEERDVSLFFSESPTNPYLRCVDVRLISQLCHSRGAIVCIDSTFATPINQRAIEFGADLVIHSATKYLGGHNDVLGGELRPHILAVPHRLSNCLRIKEPEEARLAYKVFPDLNVLRPSKIWSPMHPFRRYQKALRHRVFGEACIETCLVPVGQSGCCQLIFS